MRSIRRGVLLTTVTMVAFAANSLLCRAALAAAAIDPYVFTSIRIAAGAAVLWLLCRPKSDLPAEPAGSWGSALALVGYALPFSLAYLSLTTGTGALILFGAVQLTMIVGALLRGERPRPLRWCGWLLAIGGLVFLTLPGVSAPAPAGALLMGLAGVSWGLYSLRGRRARFPLRATARNFALALPMALATSLLGWGSWHVSGVGVMLALLSGGLASGLGYALWYRALEGLSDATAAVVQLSVPVLAAVGGIVFLGEALSLRLVLSGVAILGGIALAVSARTQTRMPPRRPSRASTTRHRRSWPR